MDFVEYHAWSRFAGNTLAVLPKISRMLYKEAPVFSNVPVEIQHLRTRLFKETPGKRGLSHLTGSCNEGHLVLFAKESKNLRRERP